jgi:Arc/MetJ-type ribon-helix-helix transcriptional regulator
MTIKLAISLPDDLVAAARQAVSEGRATSVSAYIADAIADRARNDELTELLADMAAETGRPDDEDRRWARSALGLH